MIFRRPRTRTIRALNNIYVVNTLTINALTELRTQLRSQTGPKINFEVPVVSGDRIIVARRKTKILRLLDNAIERDLYKQSLISATEVTEDYLAQILTIILKWFPQKLKITAGGVQTERKVDLDMVLEVDDLDELLSRTIEKRLVSISYVSPEQHFGYLEAILSFELPEDVKTDYAEVKATRDLLVHNSGIVNRIYLRKVGEKARASEKDLIPLDDEYFSESIRCMKCLTTYVYSTCLDKYGDV